MNFANIAGAILYYMCYNVRRHENKKRARGLFKSGVYKSALSMMHAAMPK